MKRISQVAAAFSVMALVACSSEAGSDFASGGERAPANNGASYDAPGGGSSSGGTTAGSSPGAAKSDGAAAEGAAATPGSQAQAGTLTAGVWDDNLNFDFFKKYVSLTGDPKANSLPSFSDAERAAAQTQWSAARGAKTELDLTFLIDTTGSMGDELDYVQAEVSGIATRIKTTHPNLTPRFNLVVYRDYADNYAVRSFEFGDVAQLQKNLDAQTVGGGGDYPEAVELGLEATNKLAWRTDANVARIAFWIADAPHHFGKEAAVHDAIVQASKQDVHLYPVAASGTDDRAEFTMRTAAQMTGGRYVFLTNDSGVGNDHAEPHIPCYLVTHFNDAVVRLVESELTGKHISPPEAEVLRSVGAPKDGMCQTQSNGAVAVY